MQRDRHGGGNFKGSGVFCRDSLVAEGKRAGGDCSVRADLKCRAGGRRQGPGQEFSGGEGEPVSSVDGARAEGGGAPAGVGVHGEWEPGGAGSAREGLQVAGGVWEGPDPHHPSQLCWKAWLLMTNS